MPSLSILWAMASGFVLQYGSYLHAAGECGVRIRLQAILNQAGYLVAWRETWSVTGELMGDGTAVDMDATIAAIQVAYAVNWQDVTLWINQAGSVKSAHALKGTNSLGGVRVTRPPEFPKFEGAEHVNFRTYSLELESVYPAPTGSSVVAITFLSLGSGYTYPPTITITGGGGSGAAGTCTIVSGVSSITLLSGGNLYASAPTVTITPGSGDTTGGGAVAVATISGGVASITLGSAGSGYTNTPTVVISAPNLSMGTQATAAASLNMDGTLGGITVNAAGSGYTSAPIVSIIPASGDVTGNGATAAATISASVTAVILLAAGTNYTATPTVTISGGGGVGATATAAISGVVATVTITNPGSGYTTPPTVTVSGGGGTGAKAVAVVASSSEPALWSWEESISFTGTGGPKFVMQQPLPELPGMLPALPQKQIVASHTPYKAVQSGQAVGIFGPPTPPLPLWPAAEHQELRVVDPKTPERMGNGYWRYPITWSYTFESVDPLIGLPTAWVG